MAGRAPQTRLEPSTRSARAPTAAATTATQPAECASLWRGAGRVRARACRSAGLGCACVRACVLVTASAFLVSQALPAPPVQRRKGPRRFRPASGEARRRRDRVPGLASSLFKNGTGHDHLQIACRRVTPVHLSSHWKKPFLWGLHRGLGTFGNLSRS